MMFGVLMINDGAGAGAGGDGDGDGGSAGMVM